MDFYFQAPFPIKITTLVSKKLNSDLTKFGRLFKWVKKKFINPSHRWDYNLRNNDVEKIDTKTPYED